ncbi:MAG: ROK family transcriptional regulator [Acidobacteria bacterium]|jgi:predicted NBD/HSP70 family sugar kinase|nr:MAG: ROK family transcriptional regulator [Acidobacteriota bacterium]GIU82975.1 MAG: ArsR family transcriptional regulator [Pyrinomonadaceae bacterium]
MKKIDIETAKQQVARSDTIRSINKLVVLNYIREYEPTSRAEIAKHTALQRSTVSSLVNSLIEEGLVKEIGIGESSGGRKPMLLELRRDEEAAIGVDITPSLTTVATANLAGEILEKISFPTPTDRNETFLAILKVLKKIKKGLKKEDIQIGISVPGVVDDVSGSITYVPFFGWENWDLKEKLSKKLGLSVLIDNDANAIALAESWFGKSEVRGVKSFITVLVSEGLGTGIFFDGQVYRGYKGAAGEFGHMTIGKQKSDTACSCGGRYCLEAFTSNKATLDRYNRLAGKKETSIDKVLKLASRGDKKALEAVFETIDFLALGISNLIVGLSPEVVVITGKITSLWHLIGDALTEKVASTIKQKIPMARITPSTLGENPTLLGAISLSLIKKFAKVG